MVFNYKGKTYTNAKEFGRAMFQEVASDPNNTNLVWEYQEFVNCTFIDGKMIYPDGTYGKGKCAYRGKIYEGVIEYKDNHLYVGGELVKDMNL